MNILCPSRNATISYTCEKDVQFNSNAIQNVYCVHCNLRYFYVSFRISVQRNSSITDVQYMYCTLF